MSLLQAGLQSHIGSPCVPLACSLGLAVDCGLTSATDGDDGWFPPSATCCHDGDAAQSGDIDDDQASQLETTVRVNGQKTVIFYLKVSSEQNYDYAVTGHACKMSLGSLN